MKLSPGNSNSTADDFCLKLVSLFKTDRFLNFKSCGTVCMSIGGHLQMSAVSLEQGEGIGSPESGYCDPFDVDAEDGIGSSARTVLSLNL